MQTLTKEQFEKLYGTATVNKLKTVQPSGELPQQENGFMSRIQESLGTRGQNIKDIQAEGNVGIRKNLPVAGQIAGGVTDVIGETFMTGLKAITPKPVEDLVSSGVQKVFGSEPIQDVVGQYEKIKQQYPEATRAIESIINIGSLLPVGVGAKTTTKVGGEILETGLSKSKNIISNIPENIQAIKSVPNALLDRIATENPIKLQKIKTGVAKNLNEYADEFAKSRNAISGATNKIEGFDYGNYIAEKNLLPDVTDSGRFDGRNIIKGLQDENNQLGSFVSTKLDDSVRNTNLEEFKAGLMEDITKRGGIADAESMRNYVDRYINEVRNRYGDNLSDKILYAIKTDADAGYNYLSPNADINASKLIADKARQSIRSSDPEIAKALDAQTKNYEAIRITQSLEPYKVKAGNLTTRLAQLGGSLLGANAIEGGIIQKTLGATIGALTGQRLVRALQQSAFISPASRRAIEKELMKKVKPEAVKTILKKLDNGVNLSEVETKALERAGNQLKNSSIKTNDKTTAINTSMKESIPLNKKNTQAGMISVSKDLQPLYKEAQKYKSAEEFIRSQGNPVYHGTNAEFTKFDPKYIGTQTDSGFWGKGFYFATDEKMAKIAPHGQPAKKVMEVWLPKYDKDNFKLYSPRQHKTIKETADYLGISESILQNTKDGVKPALEHAHQYSTALKDKGYQGVYIGRGRGGTELVIFDEKNLKTKKELEQIWKESNSKTSTNKGMTAVNPLTVGAGVTAVGAGAMAIKNKKKK